MRSRLFFAGAVLLACGLGCESRVLQPVIDSNAGTGGHAGSPVNTGQAGTTGAGGDAGASGVTGGGATGGTGGGASGGTGGSASGGSGVASGSGGCGISCGPLPCPVRDGQPRVLVTSPASQQLMALAVNDDTLFWGTYPSQTPGELRSMPLAGGPSTLLVDNVVVSELHLDGDGQTLYYVTNDRTGMSALAAFDFAAGTGAPRTIASGSRIGSITSNASGIFFALANAVVRADRTSPGVTSVVAVTGTLWGFAVDDANVYWAAYSNGGGLYRRALAGGATTTMRTSSAPVTFPIVDGDDVDFIEGTNTPETCASAVWALAKTAGSGAAPRLISPGTSGIDTARLILDGDTLYWASNSRHGAVLRMARGQTPEILAPEQSNVGPPVVGATDVYWIASGAGGYEIRALPK